MKILFFNPENGIQKVYQFSSKVKYEENFLGGGRDNHIQENKCLKYEWID